MAETKGLTFSTEVIEKIAGIATNEIQGIVSMSGGLTDGIAERLGRKNITKGISAEVGEKQVALDLKVITEYGQSVPTIYNKVKNKVQEVITNMTGLHVIEVNMHVEDVATHKDQKEDKQKRVQ